MLEVGAWATRLASAGVSLAWSAAVTLCATSSCTANRSESCRSYCSDQSDWPVRTLVSSTAMRTRSPARRTLPSTTLPTPSSRDIRLSRSPAVSYCAVAARLSTRSAATRESWVAISSVIPALKYCCAVSRERLRNGRTATTRRLSLGAAASA